MADSVRIKLTANNRKRKLSRLMESTGKGRKTEAIDEAIQFYLEMAAVDHGTRVGKLEEVLSTAADRGNLTAAEIAEILSTPQVQLEASTSYQIGRE